MKKSVGLILTVVMSLSVFFGCAGKDAELDVETGSEIGLETSTESDGQAFDNEYEADVIVVGAGGGGLAAALEAVEEGAEKVILLEKLNMTGGALNSTSGSISGAETVIQKEDGLTEDSLELYKEDLMNEGSKLGGIPNEELIDKYIVGAKEAVDWLWEVGLKDYEFAVDKEGNKSVFAPEHTLYSYPRTYKPRPKDETKYKSAVHEILETLVNEESKIEIHFNTLAKHLVANDKGQVLEVEAYNSDSKENNHYKASKGIIMTTGGYSANPELINHFNSDINGVITGGLAGSDGYGIYMMQEVGGSIFEESMGWVPTFPMGLENPKVEGVGRIMTTKTQFAGGILVNNEGKRFVNENHPDNVVREFELEKQPEGIQWEIYTDNIIEDLMKSPQKGMYEVFFMSEAGEEYIKTAESLEELAKVIDVPEQSLIETVENYNSHVESGEKDDFGRVFKEDENPFNLAVNKVEGDKYYAVKTKPLALLTLGGIQTDSNMNVLNENGNTIPGLYAAGEVVYTWGRYVSSGVGVTGPVVQGKDAARSLMAADLKDGDKVEKASNLIDKKFFEKKEKGSLDIDFDAEYNDGEYEATVDGQDGPMVVKVEVKDSKIDKVEIVSHNETEAIAGDSLTKIPQEISKNKSLKDVEAISGATYTYDRIMEAVIKALDGAEK